MRAAEGQPDLALVVSERPAAAAGVFTTNKFAAAPVHWCRSRLPAADARAIVINAGIANACTGRQGEEDVQSAASLVAELLDCRPGQILVASTGKIGEVLPMDKIADGIRASFERLARDDHAARTAQQAILTTDTRPKACAVRAGAGRAQFSLGAMAKGAGMIAPHMATMLCFVTTDAAVPAELLQRCLRQAADVTLNRVTVDGESSTNDSVIALASGVSGAAVTDKCLAVFQNALRTVLGELARQIAADGEGASKLVRVRVSGALNEADAERAARAVAESLLVKCAVRGGDANWGRIVCALGYSGAELSAKRTCVDIGEVRVFDSGEPTGRDASGEMTGSEVTLTIALGKGDSEATVLSCDLTEEYVRFNAEYRT